MRNAPSVRFPVGRSVFYGRLLATTGGLGLMGVALAAQHGGSRAAVAVACAWMLWIGGAIWGWQRQVCGSLVWRSQGAPGTGHAHETSAGFWSWSSLAYQEGVALNRVERVYDFQVAMLLRLHNPDGASTWAWVERRSDPVHWNDLRRALWAHG